MAKNGNNRKDYSGAVAILIILLMGLLLINGLDFLGDFFAAVFGG